MNIIISPAKKMNVREDELDWADLPCFLSKAEELKEYIRGLSRSEARALWQCNETIAGLNYGRFQAMDLTGRLTPALLSYEGIQYQYMAPHLFSHGQWEYVKNHLRILSGFYGILRPDDRVTPYRLEMQARLAVDGKKDLYDFWGSSLFEELTGKTEEETEPGSSGKAENTPVILNLASREYSKAIEPFLTPDIRFVTCVFGVLKDGKVKIKATEAKMARGEMVRFLAENNVTDVEAVKGFSVSGYGYSPEHSEENSFVFIKNHGKEEK